MKNLHTKLDEYAIKCDEILLSKQLKSVVEEASKTVEQVDSEVLHSLDKKTVLIDVREPEEFASGYIDAPTVLTIPRGKLEFMAIDKIAKVFGTDVPIITYCLKGPRGSLAGYQLQKMGFTNVKNLKGGILQWLAEGNTIYSYLGALALVKKGA